MGSTTEFVEPEQDVVNNDHIYHKNIRSSSTVDTLPESAELSKDMFFTDNSPLESNTVVFLHGEPWTDLGKNSISGDYDIGSDGNKSPYSDISSALSPSSSDGIYMDWNNDSLSELFPHLG